MKENTILVIGLGEVGLSVYEYCAKHTDLNVYGTDTSADALERANMSAKAGDAITMVDEQAKLLGDFGIKPDVISICVPCDEDGYPFLNVFNWYASKYPDALFSVECTLPDPQIGYKLRKDVDVIAFPHRISPHDPAPWNQPDGFVRVMGGRDAQSAERGFRFWSQVYGTDKIRLTSWTNAVLSKILENAARAIEIATAQEIALIAEKYKTSPSALVQDINTKENMNIKWPREGIGRHCLPYALRVCDKLAGEGNLFSAAIRANERYTR